MNKTAFIFPGQGAQYVSMGKDFYNKYEVAKETFEEANRVLGINLTSICFEGPEEALLKTENTQPAILTTSIAILRTMQEKGITCDITAGLSLGEYSALVAAGAIRFADAIKIVRNRGIFMQEAVPLGVGKMGAIIGLKAEELENVLKESRQFGIVEIANHNTDEQIVVSGEAQAVKHAVKAAKKQGARKAMLLPVSAPFHSSLLKPASDKLAALLEDVEVMCLDTPIIHNVNPHITSNSEGIKPALIRQVSHSVLWKQSVEAMLHFGVRNFIEIGPGKTLTNFSQTIADKMNMEVKSTSIETIEDLDNL